MGKTTPTAVYSNFLTRKRRAATPAFLKGVRGQRPRQKCKENPPATNGDANTTQEAKPEGAERGTRPQSVNTKAQARTRPQGAAR